MGGQSARGGVDGVLGLQRGRVGGVAAVGIGGGGGGSKWRQVSEDEVARRWARYWVGGFARWPGGQAGGQAGDQASDKTVT